MVYRPSGPGTFPAVLYNHGRRYRGRRRRGGAPIGDGSPGRQLAALAWLQQQNFVQKGRIAVAGTSFGGIEAVLGAERGSYCAAIDSAGAAQSWAQSLLLQSVMIRAVRNSKIPIFFFQAANDYDLQPSKALAAAMKDADKPYQLKIYPAFGESSGDGHSFGYFGASIWADDVFRFLEDNCREK